MYNPKFKATQIYCGSGRIAIITGWTAPLRFISELNSAVENAIASKSRKLSREPSVIAQRFIRTRIGAIGSLYSPTRGLNLLVRNLLLNPQITEIVAIDGTKEDRSAGSITALQDFFKKGVQAGISAIGKPSWIVNSLVAGYIDNEISIEALESIRENVKLRVVPSIKDAIEAVFSPIGNQFTWGDPVDYPYEEFTPTLMPGYEIAPRIEADTIADAWVMLLREIATVGKLRPTGYGGLWQECLNLVVIVNNEPEKFEIPDYLPCSRESVECYIKEQILFDSPYQAGAKYTYGQRMRSWFGRDQIEDAIAKLVKEIDAASAVINLWDAGGLNHSRLHPESGRIDYSSDHQNSGSPCLNHLWFRVIENQLILTATLRSNDMPNAWPTNAFGLRALQKYVRDEIGARSSYQLQLGALVTISQSAHAYDDMFAYAEKVGRDLYPNIARKYLHRDDSIGNYIVETLGKEVLVTRTTPGSGEIVQCYSGKNIYSLMDKIVLDAPRMKPRHALYLGAELQKEFSRTAVSSQISISISSSQEIFVNVGETLVVGTNPMEIAAQIVKEFAISANTAAKLGIALERSHSAIRNNEYIEPMFI